jgi:predicted O-methyltransferase YrrM
MKFTADWFSSHIPNWERWLWPLAGQPTQVLEIGSNEGRSAVWLLQEILTHPESRLTCVDIWDQEAVRRQFRANVQETGRGHQVIECQSDSAHALKSLTGTYDFIYIDGSHEARYVLTDIAMAWPMLRVGGLLAMDDYKWVGDVEFPPRYAIDPFLELWMTQIEVLHTGWQVIVRRRV